MSSRVLRSMLAGAVLVATGCGSGMSGSGSGTGMGTFAVELIDAPSPDVKGIVVTIDTVTANSEQAGWVTIFHGPITVDLLTLQDVAMKLGEVSLPAGQVTEVRLQLADGPQYVVLADDSHAPLKTPSGSTSGLKLKGPFTVSSCTKHTLTIDFDGKNSIAYHETGGPNPEWILRPVIRVRTEADEPQSCVDGGTPDSGTPDSGTPDSGTPDAGDSGSGADAGAPPFNTDGGFSCDPSNPSCPI